MLTDLEIEVNSTAVSTIWVSSDYNYAIYSAVQVGENSPYFLRITFTEV